MDTDGDSAASRGETRSAESLGDILERLGLDFAEMRGRAPYPEAEQLVSVGLDCNGREALLAPDAATAWARLRDAARCDGCDVLLVSAFRSYEYQVRLWERKLRAGETPAQIRRVLGVPGFSQHHTGCAIDVGTPGCTDLTERFEATAEFRWLAEHAQMFGFTMPYGRDNARGVAYEPWHWFFNIRSFA